MNEHAEILEFKNRNEYRAWLEKNHKQENGIWIVFMKGNRLFSANDALEESICFGWIDGLMKSIDEKSYRKYFSRRKDRRKWSDKNIAIYEKLLKNGLVTKVGADAYKAEKKDEKAVIDFDEKIEMLKRELKKHRDIISLFEAKTPSRQKQFAGFYGDAKTEKTQKKRIDKIIEALVNNYSGMLY